jgi:hypothetical protein
VTCGDAEFYMDVSWMLLSTRESSTPNSLALSSTPCASLQDMEVDWRLISVVQPSWSTSPFPLSPVLSAMVPSERSEVDQCYTHPSWTQHFLLSSPSPSGEVVTSQPIKTTRPFSGSFLLTG